MVFAVHSPLLIGGGVSPAMLADQADAEPYFLDPSGGLEPSPQAWDQVLGGQTQHASSTSKLLLPGAAPTSIEEIFTMGDRVIQAGGTPVVISDIDSTVAHSQLRVQRTVHEWVTEAYQGAAQTQIRNILLRDPRVRLYGDYRINWVDTIGERCWNTQELLRTLLSEREKAELLRRDPGMMDHAVEHFRKRYHDPDNWLSHEVLPKTVHFYHQLRARGFAILYASLRGDEKDRDEHGVSRTQKMLVGIDAFHGKDEIVLKTGETIYLDAAEMRHGNRNEPRKIDYSLAHLLTKTRIKKPVVIAYFDNDVLQLHYADDKLGRSVAYVYVLGEDPPGSPDPRSHLIPFEPGSKPPIIIRNHLGCFVV